MTTSPVFCSPRHRRSFLALAALFALSASAQAQLNWKTAATGDWSTTAVNWNNGSLDVAWSQGSDGNFAAANNGYTVNLREAITVGTLSSGTAPSGSTGTVLVTGNGFSLDVTTITTGAGAIDMSTAMTGNHGLTFNT